MAARFGHAASVPSTRDSFHPAAESGKLQATTSPTWALPINLVVIAPKEGQNDRQ